MMDSMQASVQDLPTSSSPSDPDIHPQTPPVPQFLSQLELTSRPASPFLRQIWSKVMAKSSENKALDNHGVDYVITFVYPPTAGMLAHPTDRYLQSHRECRQGCGGGPVREAHCCTRYCGNENGSTEWPKQLHSCVCEDTIRPEVDRRGVSLQVGLSPGSCGG